MSLHSPMMRYLLFHHYIKPRVWHFVLRWFDSSTSPATLFMNAMPETSLSASGLPENNVQRHKWNTNVLPLTRNKLLVFFVWEYILHSALSYSYDRSDWISTVQKQFHLEWLHEHVMPPFQVVPVHFLRWHMIPLLGIISNVIQK